MSDLIKEKNIKRITKIVNSYSPENPPSSMSTDIQEQRDYNWIYNKTRGKYGKSNSVWFDEIEKIAEDHGFHDLFVSCEDKFRKRVENFCQKYSKKKLPTLGKRQDKDATFLEHLKYLKKNGGLYWGKEVEEIFEKYDIKIRRKSRGKETAIKRLHDIMSYYHPNYLPKRNRNGKKDRDHQDALWLYHMRAAKRGSGLYRWYPELEKIAEENGFKGLFDRKRATYNKVT